MYIKLKFLFLNWQVKKDQYVNVYKRSWIISIAKTVWVKSLTKKMLFSWQIWLSLGGKRLNYAKIIAHIYIMEILYGHNRPIYINY